MYHTTEITENSKNIHEKLFGIKKITKKSFPFHVLFFQKKNFFIDKY